MKKHLYWLYGTDPTLSWQSCLSDRHSTGCAGLSTRDPFLPQAFPLPQPAQSQLGPKGALTRTAGSFSSLLLREGTPPCWWKRTLNLAATGKKDTSKQILRFCKLSKGETESGTEIQSFFLRVSEQQNVKPTSYAKSDCLHKRVTAQKQPVQLGLVGAVACSEGLLEHRRWGPVS